MIFQMKSRLYFCLLILALLLGVGLILSFKQQPELASKLTKAIVFPHHDLLSNNYDSFYQNFSANDLVATKKIILLSPNHFYPEVAQIVTEEKVTSADHGISIHLPLIKKYFPNAVVDPYLLTRYIQPASLDELVLDVIDDLEKEAAILIVSTDFSHYLSAEQAEIKDQETLDLILKNQAERILELSDDFLDCPACLYVLLKATDSLDNTISPEVLFHANSGQFFQKGEEKSFTTSYFVIKW